jgi:hypothetical protein
MPNIQTNSLRLPDFIGVGPPRTATTWLHEALRGHVGLPDHVKETDFFLWKYDKGLEWYAAQFRRCRPDRPMGEFSPMYFLDPEPRERIAKHIPHCKIICTFRDPVERTYSHYRRMRQAGSYSASFEECIESRQDVLEWSRYATYLKAWQQLFGRKNVLVLLQDDLKADPQSFLDPVCDFLGIPRISLVGSKLSSMLVNDIPVQPWSPRLARTARLLKESLRDYRIYAPVDLLKIAGLRKFLFGGGAAFEPLGPETDARLRELFLPEVEALEKMLGRDLSAWKSSNYRSEKSSPESANLLTNAE